MSNLVTLPNDLYYIISSFIQRKDWNQFLNASRKLDYVKYMTRYLILGSVASLKYLSDASYEEEINAKILDPKRQLNLVLTGCSNTTFLKKTKGSNRVVLAKSNIQRADEELTDSRYLTFLFCDQLAEVIPGPELRSLDLFMCPAFSDLSHLNNLSSVSLCENDRIVDVSPLKDVPELRLMHLSNLVDISSIGSRQTKVILVNCPKIVDISSLRNVHRRVEINSCHGISNIDCLVSVPFVCIEFCRKITEKVKAVLENHPHFSYLPLKET
jgi:hypothetical protein